MTAPDQADSDERTAELLERVRTGARALRGLQPRELQRLELALVAASGDESLAELREKVARRAAAEAGGRYTVSGRPRSRKGR